MLYQAHLLFSLLPLLLLFLYWCVGDRQRFMAERHALIIRLRLILTSIWISILVTLSEGFIFLRVLAVLHVFLGQIFGVLRWDT